VIWLDDDVLQNRKFREANPDHVDGMPCVYVGVSSLEPEERFEQHKRGYKACRFVKNYGEFLLPKLFQKLNPIPSEGAEDRERELAQRLRKKGYAVWQH
jgi:hypothetical protein